MKTSKKIIAGLTAVCLAMGMQAGVFTYDTAYAAEDTASKAEPIIEGAEYEKGKVLVTFDEGTSDKKIDKIADSNDAEAEDIQKTEGNKVAIMDLDKGVSVAEGLKDFASEKKVLRVQPNYKYSEDAEVPDPYYYSDGKSPREQYQFQLMNVEDAWSKVESNSHGTTKVAVIDTGVDVGHEDLQENLSSTKSYTQVYAGESHEAKSDTGSHGTHVAGIIGATWNNGKGGSGIASGHNNDLVEVEMIGASEDGEYLYTYDIVAALDIAKNSGAKVVNMSFGANVRDRVMHSKIKELYDQDIVLVASAGNEATDIWSDPSDLPEVISVTNCTRQKELHYSSNYGNAKDVAAPGTNINSTVPGDKYDGSFTGTSMSSPMVAGTAALMLDIDPDLSPAEIRNIICGTADDADGIFTSKNAGTGIVDAEAAIDAVLEGSSAATSVTISDKDSGGASKYYSAYYNSDVTEEGITVYKDDDIFMEALMTPANSSSKIKWSSSDESIATVEEDTGRVVGIKTGKVTITATAGTATDSCEVTVVKSTPPESISIKKPTSGVVVREDGLEFALEAEVTPSNGVYDEVYWSTSDKTVATVDDYGYVKGRSPGTATITAKTYNGKEDSITVTVKAMPKKVKITNSTSWGQVGDTFTFSGEVLDKNGTKMTGEKIRWQVARRSLATIDASGKMTAKKAGTVYVKAYSAGAEDENLSVLDYKKVVIAKKNYKGKADYNLRTVKKGKKSVKLRWNQNPIASGYEIQRAYGSKGKFKTVKTVKGRTKVTQTVKKLKSGKKYRFRVRAYYYKNGTKKYFSYSNTLKVTTKKAKAK